MDRPGHRTRVGLADADGPLHQHRAVGAAGGAKLEPRRLHAQRHRKRPPDCCLKQRSRDYPMTCSTRFTAFAAAAAFAGFAIGVANWTATVPAQAQQAQKAAAPSTVTAAGITFRSVSIELPSSDRMFPGDADAEAIN